MASAHRLGFQSPYVLMKIGYDLREYLADMVETPLPEEIKAQAAKIPDIDAHREFWVVTSTSRESLADKPLF